MIFNTSQESLTNNSIKLKPIQNYSSLLKKTRIESLNERILRANELINSFVEKTKIEYPDSEENKNNLQKNENKTPYVTELNEIKKEENNNTNNINTNKSVQVDEEKNNIENNGGIENNNNINEENNNNIENNTNNENNNIENNNNTNNENITNNENNINNKENNNENIITSMENIELKENQEKKEENIIKTEAKKSIKEEIDVPFIKRTKLLLMELEKLKEKSSLIKEDQINKEIITELPKRSLLEISRTQIKSKKTCEILQKKLIEKEKYIKAIESELYKQQKENMRLRKSENDYLLKISALEDELRIIKNKFISYHSRTENNSAYLYGEKIVKNIRDDILENKNINSYFSMNNNHINNNVNNNANNHNVNHNSTNMTFNKNNINNKRNSFYNNKWNAPWISQSYRKINHINNINNNESIEMNNINNHFSSNINNIHNGGQSNFQRISGMILENNNNNNKIRLNKNYGNNFNRFRNGSNDNF